MDASVRFHRTGNLSHTKYQLLQTRGVLQMALAGHSIYSATHQRAYDYLPCDEHQIKHTGKWWIYIGCASEPSLIFFVFVQFSGNTLLSEITGHVLLRRSLNFCSCTTWYLDLHDLVRTSRVWLYKEIQVSVLPANAKLVQKGVLDFESEVLGSINTQWG